MSRPEKGGWHTTQALTCAILTWWIAWIKSQRSTRGHKAVRALGCGWAPEFQEKLQRAHSGLLCLQLQRKPWMHLTIWCIPTSLLGSQKMSGECAGMVGACSDTASWVTKGDGGADFLAWALTQAHITQGTDAAAACKGTAPVYAHGAEQLQPRESKPLRIPEISTQGKMRLQLVMYWCFRWVMGKRPVFFQHEANCLQMLNFIFTGHSQTVPRITYQKGSLWKVERILLWTLPLKKQPFSKTGKTFLFRIEVDDEKINSLAPVL